jgi:hypothetical protein
VEVGEGHGGGPRGGGGIILIILSIGFERVRDIGLCNDLNCWF